MASRDLYEILGVARRATQEDIKQAYRRLARENHPDVRRDDPHATERFKEINEAYQILSDPAKRSQYDRYGRVVGDAEPFGGGINPFDDLFDFFFGTRTATRADREAPERGADLRHGLEITLEEVASGTEKRLKVTRLETCPACFGTGAERGSGRERCPTCDGTGQMRHVQRTVLGTMTQIGPCPECRGEGTYIPRPCRQCRGAGQVEAEREVTVSVPAGIEDGMHLRLAGEGEAGVRGGGRGDLFVVIHVAPHPVFTRRRRDLFCETEISTTQAALGDEIPFKALDGEVTLTVPPGTQPGTTLTVRGRGLPDLRGARGHLHVTVKVAIPRNLTAEQRALLEEFARLRGEGRGGRRKPIIKKVKDLLQ
ncbi:MAG: molecular chaperone DnaJ [Armatimonadetes bacterium]|nr:molecular chaperone DnaJ [Armatimonadota bacterium]